MNNMAEVIFSVLSSTQPWQEILFIGWWLITYKAVKGKRGIKLFAAGFVTSILYAALSQVIIVRDFGMLISFISLITGIYMLISEKGGK